MKLHLRTTRGRSWGFHLAGSTAALLAGALSLSLLAGTVAAGETRSAQRYDAGGRRDPFVSPTARVEKPRVQGTRGFEVQSVELTGIVSTPEGFTAMITGPDHKTYFVHVGERFYNGTLVDMDQGSLTFQVQDPNPLVGLSPKHVVLSLHPTE